MPSICKCCAAKIAISPGMYEKIWIVRSGTRTIIPQVTQVEAMHVLLTQLETQLAIDDHTDVVTESIEGVDI